LLVASIPSYPLIKPFRGARFQTVVKKRLIKTDDRTGCSGFVNSCLCGEKIPEKQAYYSTVPPFVTQISRPHVIVEIRPGGSFGEVA
jgi:hypothetical protein